MIPIKRIHTNHYPTTLERRDYDWQAFFEGRTIDGPYGTGATEAEAIAMLLKAWNSQDVPLANKMRALRARKHTLEAAGVGADAFNPSYYLGVLSGTDSGWIKSGGFQ